MNPFQYHEPQSLAETVTLLSGETGAGAHIIAGGSDLLDEVKEGIISPERVVSLAGVPDLAGIAETEDGLRIGAMTTIADVAANPVVRTAYTALGRGSRGAGYAADSQRRYPGGKP